MRVGAELSDMAGRVLRLCQIWHGIQLVEDRPVTRENKAILLKLKAEFGSLMTELEPYARHFTTAAERHRIASLVQTILDTKSAD